MTTLARNGDEHVHACSDVRARVYRGTSLMVQGYLAHNTFSDVRARVVTLLPHSRELPRDPQNSRSMCYGERGAVGFLCEGGERAREKEGDSERARRPSTHSCCGRGGGVLSAR